MFLIGRLVTLSLALSTSDKIFISPRHRHLCQPDYKHKLNFYVLVKGPGHEVKCYFRKSYSATFIAYLGFLSSSALNITPMAPSMHIFPSASSLSSISQVYFIFHKNHTFRAQPLFAV